MNKAQPSRLKLVVASIATGILVTTATFITVLFVRALFKDAVSVTFALWFFWWPIWFLRYLPGIDDVLLWVSLAMGILLDMVFISIATYLVLRAILSRQKRVRAATPPEPPNFHSRNA